MCNNRIEKISKTVSCAARMVILSSPLDDEFGCDDSRYCQDITAKTTTLEILTHQLATDKIHFNVVGQVQQFPCVLYNGISIELK